MALELASLHSTAKQWLKWALGRRRFKHTGLPLTCEFLPRHNFKVLGEGLGPDWHITRTDLLAD